MNPPAQTKVTAIEFDEIEFTETPTGIVLEAIRDYEASQPELESDDAFSPDSAWGRLANQVVGQETI